jgi:hypothetical protein
MLCTRNIKSIGPVAAFSGQYAKFVTYLDCDLLIMVTSVLEKHAVFISQP